MLLEIRDIKTNSFKIGVKPSDTIMHVKEKIKKLDILDIDDQTLVYSGNILANDSTVEECHLNKNDYVTLLYPPSKQDGVFKMMALHGSKFEDSKDSDLNFQDSSANVTSTDNSESFASESQNTTEELISSVGQMTDSDSDSDDLSRYALLESIPDVDKLYNVINNNPVEVPRILSKLLRQGPIVFEKILEHPHAYIELLNAGIVEHSSSDYGIEQIETTDDEAIDRLVKKGYKKEMVLQVYQACHFNEIDAAELLNYLH